MFHLGIVAVVYSRVHTCYVHGRVRNNYKSTVIVLTRRLTGCYRWSTTVDDIIIHVEEVANDVSVVVIRWILLCPEYTQNGSYYVVELA